MLYLLFSYAYGGYDASSTVLFPPVVFFFSCLVAVSSDRWASSSHTQHTTYRLRDWKICGKESILVSPSHIRFVSCILGCASIIIVGKKWCITIRKKYRFCFWSSKQQTNIDIKCICFEMFSPECTTIDSSAVQIIIFNWFHS